MKSASNSLQAKIESEEKIIQRKSIAYTVLFFILLILICWFWIALLALLPAPVEKKYEIVGSIDFGDLSEGSQEINNFEPVVENANPNPVSQEVQTPVEQVQTPVEEIISTDQPAETQVTQVPEKKKKIIDWTMKSGGANDGKSNQAGNKGSPDAKELNPDGMYAFGNGSDGLQGRRILAQPKPDYSTQEDSRITYKIVIAPDGRVVEVIPITISSAHNLTHAGKEALKKWKFNDISSNAAARNQSLKVTITFKLR